jgi:hypothetical protein
MTPSNPAERLANKLMMMRSQAKSTFVVVEGEDDKKLFSNLLCTSELYIAHGHPTVRETVRLLRERGCLTVVGIIDADFEHIENKVLPPGLVRTDLHDVECMLLASPALEKVLTEHGDSTRIIEATTHRTLRERLLDHGLILGQLRYISHQKKLSITFDGLDFSEFLDEKKWQFDSSKLLSSLRKLNKGTAQNIWQAEQVLSSLPSLDPWQLCCGHELVEILAIGLYRVLGNSPNLKASLLETDLRLAYERRFFEQTHLYQQLQTWQSTHPSAPPILFP